MLWLRAFGLMAVVFHAAAPVESWAEDTDTFFTKDSRTRVEKIVDGLTHMPANATELQRQKEWIEALKTTDSVAPQLWKIITERIERNSLLAVANALPILGEVPGGRDYKKAVTELMVDHARRIDTALSNEKLEEAGRNEAHSSFMIVSGAIGYFQNKEDIVVIAPLLGSKDASVVFKAMSWIAGKGDKEAIELLEKFTRSEGPPEFHKDRAVEAIRAIERRFGMPVRPPRNKATGAPLPVTD